MTTNVDSLLKNKTVLILSSGGYPRDFVIDSLIDFKLNVRMYDDPQTKIHALLNQGLYDVFSAIYFIVFDCFGFCLFVCLFFVFCCCFILFYFYLNFLFLLLFSVLFWFWFFVLFWFFF